MKQEMMGWQWHQLDNMQITSLAPRSREITTITQCFYRLGALPDTQPTVSKHWRHENPSI